MKKVNLVVSVIAVIVSCVFLSIGVVGCANQATRVSANLSQEADNFNVVRELTVINCIQGDVIFQMTGKMSISADALDNQLEVTVEDENGDYQKHFIGLSDNVTYVVEQKRAKSVDNYKYTLNFNPKMWIPVGAKIID